MKLTETKNGTIIEIHVKPNQPQFKILIEREDVVIFSTEEPIKGRANKEIVKELTKIFHANVELISGSSSKEKRLIVNGLGKNDTAEILAKNAVVQ